MGWGEFFSLASPMAWALAVVLFRRSGETMPPFELNLLKNVLSLGLMVLSLVLMMAVSTQPWPDFSPSDITIIVLSGVMGMALADTLYLRTLNLVGAGRTGAVGSLLTPLVIFISALYLGERLGPAQWGGFALVMVGILVITLKRYQTEVSAEELRRGLLLGVTAMVLMSAGVVMVKPQLEQGPFLWVVTLRLAGGVVAMLAFIAWQRRWGEVVTIYRRRHPWPTTLFACFLGGFGGSLLWLAGYMLIPASEAAVYNESQIIFMVLFAWWFLGEPVGYRKAFGVLLILAGVLTMLLV